MELPLGEEAVRLSKRARAAHLAQYLMTGFRSRSIHPEMQKFEARIGLRAFVLRLRAQSLDYDIYEDSLHEKEGMNMRHVPLSPVHS